MQLDKIITYHKALSDATRIRMLILLRDGELNGQVLAEKLGVTPATITHHAAKLREASLIHERRDKNTIYFALNEYFIRSNASATADLIFKNQKGEASTMQTEDTRQNLKQSIIRNFFTQDGKLKHIPSQLKKKLIVLGHLIDQLDKGRTYTEKELNEWIKQYHPDFATIRREFIMHQFMFRENEIYELNPPEMWAKWETLS
ncbi:MULTISPECIES: metalloregulator ArsR/SmtB family transcription factor [Paenibacillus]|uniref:Metalloregulator ArsR/SmtB family transcription factor n=1 Tax=Paenibacillus violae TaxID=3077234 RepID=A0ABU3RIE4_9BACL|nr:MULTISPECIES: metalloregulator ArsR/SmtB family transcription factor [Paenibacillus]MDU0203851.1 metalloregulator ArsR/SmtB family transcription factor [Paenibacillus sp. PFR10]MEC0264478.1 metalloregulator ArsR/SmtB family transcription factor [Paenibacillus anseongense]